MQIKEVEEKTGLTKKSDSILRGIGTHSDY